MKTLVRILTVILFIYPAAGFAAAGPQVTIVHDERPGAIAAGQIDQRYDWMYLVEVMNNKQQGAIFPDVNKEPPYWIVTR